MSFFKAESKKRLRQLDILRGVAVLLVIGHHVILQPEESGMFQPLVNVLIRFGWSGVDLFFVLSGFLVGGLLFSELRSRSVLDVRRFVVSDSGHSRREGLETLRDPDARSHRRCLVPAELRRVAVGTHVVARHRRTLLSAVTFAATASSQIWTAPPAFGLLSSRDRNWRHGAVHRTQIPGYRAPAV